MWRCSKQTDQVAVPWTLTTMFVDMSRSTELVERLGDDAWMMVRARFQRAARSAAKETGGTVVKFNGDGCMVMFCSARRALECALELQRDFEGERDAETSSAISVRIGIHTGEVLALEGDFFGRSVVVAARVADQAQGGEVLITQVTRDVIEGSGEFSFGEARSARLKGLSGSFELHVLDCGSHLSVAGDAD